ncbi:hypothetical protein EDC19_0222 [Natranaerovirga hydrolytica]|uniref:Uncharacterized protein n=1 Tax=Natranaerovirga hydrolytica TaxID=680378 RepID=A0A4R1MYY5_9FIRM|nr:hypothetical protein [Natranaerovirga hydrolytica]TCK97820.1 hypothetical protein EDC19_0222 [Natranaerovirga hydrolytica]
MINYHPDATHTIKNNNEPISKPYMGNYTSAEIGNMVRSGLLAGEMHRNMTKHQEAKDMNQDPQKFF